MWSRSRIPYNSKVAGHPRRTTYYSQSLKPPDPAIILKDFIMHRLTWLVLLTCGLIGCSGTEDPTKKDELESSSVDLDIIEDRDSIEGRWQLVMYPENPGQLTPQPMAMAVLEVSKDGEEYSAKILDVPENAPKIQLKNFEGKPESLQLAFVVENAPYKFEGRLLDSKLRGTVLMGDIVAIPSELIPTNSLVISDSRPLIAVTEFEDAARSEDRFKAMSKFAADYPNSPLSLYALEFVLRRLEDDADPAEVAELVKNYRELAKSWSDSMARTALVNATFSLASSSVSPDLAAQLLKDLKDSFNGEVPPQFKQVIAVADSQIRMSKARAMLTSEDVAQQETGRELLLELVRDNPFNFDAKMQLGDYAAEHDKADEAIEWYGGLAILPGLEQQLVEQMGKNRDMSRLPSTKVQATWKKKYGTIEGLDNQMIKIYRDIIVDMGVESDEIAAEGNRSVLCELFTGSSCQPCVAADVATGLVEHHFPGSHVYVLRYHQHIPSSDPLVCADGESRFDYYNGRGTPTILVNGKQVEGSGSIIVAKAVYLELAKRIKPILTEKTDLGIELSAQVNGTTIQLDAIATGQETFPDSMRLRFALAEDETVLLAINGILIHDTVVRAMPGGANGIAPQNGSLEYHAKVDLIEVRKKLIDYLSQFETGRGLNFAVKPVELRNLHIVAMLQDDETKEILQSKRIELQVDLPALNAAPAQKPQSAEPTDATGEAPKADDDTKPAGEKSVEKTPAGEPTEPAAKPESAESAASEPGQDAPPKQPE